MSDFRVSDQPTKVQKSGDEAAAGGEREADLGSLAQSLGVTVPSAGSPSAEPAASPTSESKGNASAPAASPAASPGASPAATHKARPDPFRFCREIKDGEVARKIRDDIRDIVYRGGPKARDAKSELPGPLPHTLGRPDMEILRANNYWVGEKSDGQRVMLFVTPQRAVLADRKFTLYEIVDPSGTYARLLGQGKTLVDGELIENAGGPPPWLRPAPAAAAAAAAGGAAATVDDDAAHANDPQHPESWTTSPLLVVFDAVQVGGKYCGDLTLTKRLGHIAGVKGPIKHALSTGVKLPLRIESKAFVPAKLAALDALEGAIRPAAAGGEFVYANEDKGVLALNDGLIFTPEENDYLHTRPLPIFKYKQSHTIDMLLLRPWFRGDKLALYTTAQRRDDGGRGGRRATCYFGSVSVSAEDRAKVAALSRDRVVAELGRAEGGAGWAIKVFRWEKEHPNALNTVMSASGTPRAPRCVLLLRACTLIPL